MNLELAQKHVAFLTADTAKRMIVGVHNSGDAKASNFAAVRIVVTRSCRRSFVQVLVEIHFVSVQTRQAVAVCVVGVAAGILSYQTIAIKRDVATD